MWEKCKQDLVERFWWRHAFRLQSLSNCTLSFVSSCHCQKLFMQYICVEQGILQLRPWNCGSATAFCLFACQRLVVCCLLLLLLLLLWSLLLSQWWFLLGNHNLQVNPHVHQQHIVLATTFWSGLPQPLSSQVKWFDLIKAGATQTETSLLKQYVAGERVDLLDDNCCRYSFIQCESVNTDYACRHVWREGRLRTLLITHCGK